MQFNGKTFLVVGTGKSGVAATTLLLKMGAAVIVLEGNSSLSRE